MTTNVKKSTKSPVKKRNSFSLKDIRVRQDKYGIVYISYKGKKLKKYKDSCRAVFKCGKYIIKVEPIFECRAQTKGEANFYKLLQKKDEKYFPKLIAMDLRRGIIVQEFVRMTYVGLLATGGIRRKVSALVKKYNICDVFWNKGEQVNWGIREENKQPVIYDIGFIAS